MCMLESKGKQQLATKVKVKGSGEGSEKGIFSKKELMFAKTQR